MIDLQGMSLVTTGAVLMTLTAVQIVPLLVTDS